MVMGRPNKGLEHVEAVDAGRQAKDRLKAILGTLGGDASVNDASASVGLQPARFGQLRRIALQGAADALEPGRPGRPPKQDAEEARRIAELEARVVELQGEVARMQLKLDVARAAPGVLERAQKGGSRAKVRSRPAGAGGRRKPR